MRKFVTEHQSPYLDLTTEVSDILGSLTLNS